MQNISKAEKELNVKFKNKNILEIALTHKSANKNINNEKLEFLGDRVIGLVLSEKLFNLYPNESEGVLDKRFAILVKKKTCYEIAVSLNMKNYIILGNAKKKIDKSNEKILSDCCEAIIGAIYLDQGFNYVKSFILRVWKQKISNSNITVLDSKTKLQEYSLKKFKSLPVYKVLSLTGPGHQPVYKVSVCISGTKKFIGIGNSKQQAEQDSAKKLIISEDI